MVSFQSFCQGLIVLSFCHWMMWWSFEVDQGYGLLSIVFPGFDTNWMNWWTFNERPVNLYFLVPKHTRQSTTKSVPPTYLKAQKKLFVHLSDPLVWYGYDGNWNIPGGSTFVKIRTLSNFVGGKNVRMDKGEIFAWIVWKLNKNQGTQFDCWKSPI